MVGTKKKLTATAQSALKKLPMRNEGRAMARASGQEIKKIKGKK